MHFGLKNAETTYQRVATTLLHEMIHKEIEAYIDYMIVKYKDNERHVNTLEVLWKNLSLQVKAKSKEVYFLGSY